VCTPCVVFWRLTTKVKWVSVYGALRLNEGRTPRSLGYSGDSDRQNARKAMHHDGILPDPT
jgi:hypothetical protein